MISLKSESQIYALFFELFELSNELIDLKILVTVEPELSDLKFLLTVEPELSDLKLLGPDWLP